MNKDKNACQKRSSVTNVQIQNSLCSSILMSAFGQIHTSPSSTTRGSNTMYTSSESVANFIIIHLS